MDLLNVPDMDQFLRPFFLTSLIIGMVILIFLEKRREGSDEEIKQNGTLTLGNTTTKTKGEEIIKNSVVENKENKEGVPESCSSSGSEEEQSSKPLRTPRQPKKKDKCKGSAVICATKRKVTAVSIVTDSQEKEVQVSLDELAGEIRSQGVTCSVHPALTHLLPSITREPSHLLLVFGTSSEGCQGLQESVTVALGGEGAVPPPPPPPQPFLYSVACWSGTTAGDVYECASALSASLVSCGGAEWLPFTCITTTALGDSHEAPVMNGDSHEAPVMSREEYVKTVMEKLTKPAKKCCGTSCGSKTVDIEDLAASLLLPQATVTS